MYELMDTAPDMQDGIPTQQGEAAPRAEPDEAATSWLGNLSMDRFGAMPPQPPEVEPVLALTRPPENAGVVENMSEFARVAQLVCLSAFLQTEIPVTGMTADDTQYTDLAARTAPWN